MQSERPDDNRFRSLVNTTITKINKGFKHLRVWIATATNFEVSMGRMGFVDGRDVGWVEDERYQ